MFQKHQFRFENRWLREPELQPIVEECWTRNRESDVLRRLTLCSKVLDPWGKTVDGNFRTKIRKCKEKLESLRDKYDEESTTKFKETNAQLASLLVEEEDYWRQRAKQYWLKEGDRNTRFFHTSASARKQTNKISGLKDVNGHWQDEQKKHLRSGTKLLPKSIRRK
ncbi:uncharacterized protein [Primulina eburnea]|uniref:uncharacterized protein n=1 Tax=Primulina eburnea TaxID=1245227 RepID=UPI003C6C2AA5